MNRIIRTALASVGAAVVITGGGLGVAYATTPPSAPAQTSASADADQVAALNQAADDLLAKIATLEKQLASTPDPTSSAPELAKQESTASSTQAAFPAAQVTRTTAPAQAPVTAAAATTAQRTGERDSQNGNNTND
jgi:N-acetyl-beta-hexosaminidase